MKRITLQELKKIEFELLVAVHNICELNGFRYSLGGGTLLGAVRHKGFIPWDDDIDIMMPRPDYDAFIEYCISNKVPFGVLSWETDQTYVDLSAKIYDLKTVIEDENTENNKKQIGVNIDIFPIDGLGNTYEEAVKVFNATAFKRELLVAARWKRYFRSKTKPWYYEPIRLFMFCISRFINKKKTFEKVLKRYQNINFNEVEFAAAVGGAYRKKEIFVRTLFTNYIDLLFEGHYFKAIADYDQYLSQIHGDYMKLPPEDRRKSHHTFNAFYIN